MTLASAEQQWPKKRSEMRRQPDVHLIVAEDAEVMVERYPEDWLAMLVFWSLAFIVFLQFFTRYVLNDSLAWTEEIARYGLMWVTFIGGAMVTRRKTHIAVELISNLMPAGAVRQALLAFVDIVTLGFLALLAYFSVTITERMAFQRMTVFELPMSYVYAGVALGCSADVRCGRRRTCGATCDRAGAARTTCTTRSLPD